MGTQTEGGRGIENPLKGEWERMRKWQPYKGAWNSLLQGPRFFDTPYPSPLSPIAHAHTLPRLAQAVPNLGAPRFMPDVMQRKGKLPAGAPWASF